MTTEMIEISSFNEKTLTKTTFAPFAWFSWPTDLWTIISATLRGIRLSGGYVQKAVVNSPTGRVTERAKVIKTSFLRPIFTQRTFNDPDDFKKASSL